VKKERLTMAKIAFSKLKCKLNEAITTINMDDDIVIEVKQYLPIQEKLKLIGRVIEQAHEQDENYSNPVKVEVYMALEVIFAYTNIAFTDKQKEDLPKLYDLLASSGMIEKVYSAIPSVELGAVQSGIYTSIDSVYKYQNSVLGMLDNITHSYKETDVDVEKLQTQVQELANSETLKQILPLLGLE
jgi:hypothetical protein